MTRFVRGSRVSLDPVVRGVIPPPVAQPAVGGGVRRRAIRALRHPPNWAQFVKFAAVGAIGYVINLAVYYGLVKETGLHYLPAAVCSFLVAVTNNYTWNRVWTFRGQRGHFGYQGLRFFIVSTLVLGGNLLVLRGLVAAGIGKVSAQALAIALVTPLNYAGNRLWSFRHRQ
jgi:dolichol-phosphate mannosyltransferase